MDINESLNFVINGNSYMIEFPRVGQYRTIEVMKHNLSLNSYGGMTRSMTASSDEALDMIDMESYFTVLCPQLLKDLKCDSFSDLGLVDYKELKEAFNKQFVPWWNQIEKILRPTPKQKVKKEEEDGSESD